MNAIVIYTSKYGYTETYARWIAEALDAPLCEASSVSPSQLIEYDVVVYGGGLYAGGIAGAKLVANNPCKALVVFTVGLATPESTDYSHLLERNFTEEQRSNTRFFHLQGGIDYRRLSVVHRAMMAFMKAQIAKKPASERSRDDQQLLKTYGAKVDFTNKSAIQPLVDYIRRHFPQ